jgi:threonine synthase
MAATHSTLSLLECPKCSERFDPDAVRQLCTCGSPLLARYDLERAGRLVAKSDIAQRGAALWRWRELLPLRDDINVVSLGETRTPILSLAHIGRSIGIDRLAVKDESLLPTGSFKARGAAIGVSRAKELGVRALAMPTNGNAGGAWATYGRRAGIDSYIAMPNSAPAVHRFECLMSGAEVHFVDGSISDAGRLVARVVEERNVYDASTLKEPYRIEGKKTMGFEIAEQFGWDAPDVILYPTGGGVGLIGIDKALRELRELGWIGKRLPRMVAVQSSGCAPIVRAWTSGTRASERWENAASVAFGITVPKAIGDFLVLDSIRDTDGCAIAVDDDAIIAARKRVAAEEGLLMCLEGAATMAAAELLRAREWIRNGERVLLINTGSGLKSSPV